MNLLTSLLFVWALCATLLLIRQWQRRRAAERRLTTETAMYRLARYTRSPQNMNLFDNSPLLFDWTEADKKRFRQRTLTSMHGMEGN